MVTCQDCCAVLVISNPPPLSNAEVDGEVTLRAYILGSMTTVDNNDDAWTLAYKDINTNNTHFQQETTGNDTI